MKKQTYTMYCNNLKRKTADYLEIYCCKQDAFTMGGCPYPCTAFIESEIAKLKENQRLLHAIYYTYCQNLDEQYEASMFRHYVCKQNAMIDAGCPINCKKLKSCFEK